MQPVAVSLYDASDHVADSNHRPRLSHGHGALINDKQAARFENLNNVLWHFYYSWRTNGHFTI